MTMPTTPPPAAPAPSQGAAAAAQPPAQAGQQVQQVPAAGEQPTPAQAEARKPSAPALERALALERAAKAQRTTLSAKEKELAERAQALDAQAKDLAQLRELSGLLEKDPLAFAARVAGGEEKMESLLQSLTDAVLAKGGKAGAKPAAAELPEEVKARLEKMAAMQQALEELKAQREEERSQRQKAEAAYHERAAATFLDEGWKKLEGNRTSFDLLLATPRGRERVETKVLEYAQREKKLPDYGAIAAKVLAEIEAEVAPLLQSEYVRGKLGVQSKAGPSPTSSPSGAPKTVTNHRGDPPTSDDWENLTPKQRLLRFKNGVRPR